MASSHVLRRHTCAHSGGWATPGPGCPGAQGARGKEHLWASVLPSCTYFCVWSLGEGRGSRPLELGTATLSSSRSLGTSNHPVCCVFFVAEASRVQGMQWLSENKLWGESPAMFSVRFWLISKGHACTASAPCRFRTSSRGHLWAGTTSWADSPQPWASQR